MMCMCNEDIRITLLNNIITAPDRYGVYLLKKKGLPYATMEKI